MTRSAEPCVLEAQRCAPLSPHPTLPTFASLCLSPQTSPAAGPGIIISPYSIAQALAMLLNGARPNGDSFDQLAVRPASGAAVQCQSCSREGSFANSICKFALLPGPESACCSRPLCLSRAGAVWFRPGDSCAAGGPVSGPHHPPALQPSRHRHPCAKCQQRVAEGGEMRNSPSRTWIGCRCEDWAGRAG